MNPKAGRQRVDLWDRDLRSALGALGVDHEIVRTSRPAEAGKLAATLATKHELVAAVGGDGTVHEVAQGLVATQCILGLIPNGSGNDVNRFLRMPRNVARAAAALASSTEIVSIDTAEVFIVKSLSGVQIKRWVINTLGLGYDAAVAFRRERVPILKGLPLYLTSALWTLADHSPQAFEIALDDGHSRLMEGFMVCLGIGKFEGGGFKVLPDAIHDDGLADVCEVASVSKARLLPLLIKAVFGAHTKSQYVRMSRARTATVRSSKPFAVHADGELLSPDATEVRYEIRPRSLKVAKFMSVV